MRFVLLQYTSASGKLTVVTRCRKDGIMQEFWYTPEHPYLVPEMEDIAAAGKVFDVRQLPAPFADKALCPAPQWPYSDQEFSRFVSLEQRRHKAAILSFLEAGGDLREECQRQWRVMNERPCLPPMKKAEIDDEPF